MPLCHDVVVTVDLCFRCVLLWVLLHLACGVRRLEPRRVVVARILLLLHAARDAGQLGVRQVGRVSLQARRVQT